MKQWIAKANPWEPLDYDEDVTYAVRAFQNGSANVSQQKLLWAWLIDYGCGRDGLSFRPDDKGGQRATDFAEGKRYLGQQVRKHLDDRMTPPAKNVKPEAPKQSKRKRKAAA